MDILDRLIQPVVDRLKGRKSRATWTMAPPGYDPTRDPDGAQLAAMLGKTPGAARTGADKWRALATSMLSIWWAWLLLVGFVAWGWYWWGVRPAQAQAQIVATSTAIAARWTPTAAPTAASTVAFAPVTAENPTKTPARPRPETSTPTPVEPAKTLIEPVETRPTRTRVPTRTPTPTLTATPTWTPPSVATATPTPTPVPTETPASVPVVTTTSVVAPTPVPGEYANLAAASAMAGDSMAVTGQVSNGSLVRILWEDGRQLAQARPGLGGNFAAAFVVPQAARGYHVVYVVWSKGKDDQVIGLILNIDLYPTAIPTLTSIPTWTPTPTPVTPTPTPTITPTPTLTPTPYPTPQGGWPFRYFLSLIFKSAPATFDSPLY